MGLIKRSNHEVKGVNLPQAYAKINRLYMENGNHARVYFGISSDRENLNNSLSLEEKLYECIVDKNGKVYEQIYNLAKLDIFEGWEDDIVVEEPVDNEQIEPSTEEQLLDQQAQISEIVSENDEATE